VETTLIFVEIVFYLTASVVIVVIGVLCAILTYQLIHIARELEELSKNINNASSETGEQIKSIIDRFSDLPIFSYFLKKYSAKRDMKGRGKVSKK